MRGSESFPEEALGGCGIARRTQQKVDGLARRVYSPIKVIPLLLDLDVRLIDAVGVIRRCEMAPIPLVKFGRIALHPPKHGGVIDGDASFLHQFFDITVAQGIAEIPSHATNDDLTSQVTPCEEWGLVHERSPGI